MKRTTEQKRVLKQAPRAGRSKYKTGEARRKAVSRAKPVKARATSTAGSSKS